MKYLVSIGVKDVFFLAGGGCMHLLDSLGRCKELNKVANLHEQCSAIGAGGYAQYTQNIGACLVTTGPGGTNAITGVAAAWIDSTPMIVLAGQVKRADLMDGKGIRQMGAQEVDSISIVRPITKYAARIMEPMDVRKQLEQAVYLARHGRKGPVWLEIPLDIQGAMIDEEQLEGFIPEEEKTEVIDYSYEVYKLLNASKRPAILVGNGVRAAGVIETFREVIEKWNIPVLTTWRALDIIEEEHPLYFGRPGSVGQRTANFIQQTCDLIICIGARLDVGQIGYNYAHFAPKAKKIIVDIDSNEIRKIGTKIELPIVSDAKDFVIQMKDNLRLMKTIERDEWLEKCQSWKEKYPVILEEYRQNEKYISTYAFVDALSEILTNTDIIVPGSSGTCSEVTCQSIRIKKGQRLINSPGLGSMGFGVAESIGVCIASGYKRTICIIGDGGLQHNIQELELLKRYNLPIKLFVLNNNAYASIRLMQQRNFEGNLVGCDASSGVTIPDTLKVASAYGLPTSQISQYEQLKRTISEMLSTEGPAVCEVMIDPNMQTQPRLTTRVEEDGKIVSAPFEDLWPFLDREEFEANMQI